MKKIFLFPQFFIFLAIAGPGIISAIAGNDAGGITTFSVAGASFGYAFFWTLIPIMILLIIVQEMCARMGIVTGKGLADLIRENFGLRVTFFLMMGLFFANFATTVSEFAGIAAASELFGLNSTFIVILAGLIILFFIIRINYKSMEKVFLFMCFFYITYVISGILAKPDWSHVVSSIVTPSFSFNKEYLLIFVGLIGTSVTPWMQFYLQASIVEKGVKIGEYIYTKWELILAGIVAATISFFILLASAATLFPHHIQIETAAQAAVALEPFAGHFAEIFFALGLFAAAFFAAFILPLSTAYYVCEAFGWESGVNKKFHEAKEFYTIICLLILPSMIVVIFPVPLIKLMLFAQVVNGLLLPVILFVILYLINKEKIMGDYTNKSFYNIICWISVLAISAVALIMVCVTLWQMI